MLPANVLFMPLDLDKSVKTLVKLNRSRLSLLEKSTVSTALKIDILRLLMIRKWSLEITDDIEQVKLLLDELGVPNYIGGSGVIAGATSSVIEYLKVHGDMLSEFEKGILAGHPRSSVLAATGLIERKVLPNRRLDVVDTYIAGAYSKRLFAREREYYEHEWDLVRQTSSIIYSEAQRQS